MSDTSWRRRSRAVWRPLILSLLLVFKMVGYVSAQDDVAWLPSPSIRIDPSLFDPPRSCIARMTQPVFVEVNPGESIQDAVDAATPGTIILVRAGLYNENVRFNRNVNGTYDNPILLVSADGLGMARIEAVEGSDLPVINGRGTEFVGVYGFHLLANANAQKADAGGIFFHQSGRDYTDMVANVVIAGNRVEGKGRDGIKLSQTSNAQVVANVVDGVWSKGEALDNVAVRDSQFLFNTIVGQAERSGITVKLGSQNIEIRGNLFDVTAPAGMVVGGWGTSQFNNPDFPRDIFGRFAAERIQVRRNIVTAKTEVAVYLAGARHSTVEDNVLKSRWLSVRSVVNNLGQESFGNVIRTNLVSIRDFHQIAISDNSIPAESPLHGKGYVVEGNRLRGAPSWSAGISAFSGKILDLCP